MLKTACCSIVCFHDFSSFQPPKSTSKSIFFSIIFESFDFAKILTKHWLCAQKSRFELKKKQEKLPKNRSRNAFEKSIAKNCQKIDLRVHFGLPTPPKIVANRPGTQKNAVLDEACFATLWNSPANRRKASQLVVCKASIRPNI